VSERGNRPEARRFGHRLFPRGIALLVRLLGASALRHRRFRLFYLGSVGTALGYTMQATVAAWLMATLTPSALMVALVQTASTAPSVLFGLAAGALADIVDRRRVLLIAQVLLLATTALLGAAALAGAIGPAALLALTFVIGVGFTFYLPAQQAMINDLVPHAELSPAVALGAVAFNVSRAVGPALAGALTAWLGAGSALLASAALFSGMIVAVRGWQNPPRAIPGVPETLLSGVGSGLRYARHSPPLRAVVSRNVSFSVCASALWALLPVVARDQFQMGAGGYGFLFACFGAGAVAGAIAMPRHLQRLSLNKLVNAGAVSWALATLLVASTTITAIAVVGIIAAGSAWVSVLASLSAGTQTSAPAWVRARALAINLVAMQASLAAGSALWGWLASAAGLRITLAVSAASMLLLLGLTRRVRVSLGHEADLVSGVQLPELSVPAEPKPDDGPVLIQLEYRIDPEHRADFLRAIHAVEPARRRNGASSWRIFRDLEDEGRFVERFVIRSWGEYVRLRTRLTRTDEGLHEQVTRLQRPGEPIRISRLIGIGLDDAETGRKES
jgi:MFS family permease